VWCQAEYSFIKYVPIAVATSASHVSGRAMKRCGLSGQGLTLHYFCLIVRCPGAERECSGYKYQVAPDRAITGDGANDTPVQPQSERYQFRRRQWGRLCENHSWGETPVERVRCPPLDDFPCFGVSRTNRDILIYEK